MAEEYNGTTSSSNMVCKMPLPASPFPARPFWVGDYFTHVMPVLMAQYMIFTLISQLFHRCLRCFHQTRFVSNVMAAVVMGPTVLGRSKYISSKLYPIIQWNAQNALAYMGILLHLFIVAVKVDSRCMMTRERLKAFKVAIPSALVTYVVYLHCLHYLSIYDTHLTIYAVGGITTAFAFSFNPNIVAALSELNIMSSEINRFSIICIVASDIIQCFFMSCISILNQRSFAMSMVTLTLELLMVVFYIWVLRAYAKRIINRTPKDKQVSRSYLTSFILGALVMHVVSSKLYGNSIAGTIFFGLAIPSGPPLGSTLVKTVELVTDEILLPFFYIQLGTNIDLTLLSNSKTFYLLSLIIVFGTIVKFLLAMVLCRFCKFNSRDSRTIATTLQFPGIITIFIFQELKDSMAMNDLIFSSLILITVLLHAIVTLLVKYLHQINEITIDSNNQSMSGHSTSDKNHTPLSIQTSREDSEFRVITCVFSESNVSSLTTILEISNPNTIKTVSCSVCAYVIHMSELDGQTLPFFGPHFNHTRICQHNGCDKILSAFNNYTRLSKEQVVIMPFTSISPYKAMHEEICKLAKDKDIPLIILPFYHNNNDYITANQAIGMRSVYNKMQQQAQCTIGILVDKSQQSRSLPFMPMKKCQFSGGEITNNYNMMVIFIGGPDDREALAYGLRMLEHSGLNLTLLHIQMTDEWEMTYHDEDILLIEQFRTMSNTTYIDIIVQDWEKAMEAMRQLVNDYDLVIVGQRQGISSMRLQQEMMEWMDNPELGLIGDMLASADFNSTLKLVLVLHHQGNANVENSSSSSVKQHDKLLGYSSTADEHKSAAMDLV